MSASGPGWETARFFGRGFLRSVVLVPWAMASVSVGVLWSFLFAGDFGGSNGVLNDLSLALLATPWLGNDFRALNLVALVHVWNQALLSALMLLAGLQSMLASLHKAAMLDGARPVRRFVSITLPWRAAGACRAVRQGIGVRRGKRHSDRPAGAGRGTGASRRRGGGRIS